jgi:putative peptidoglycan lipid II flippase
MIAFRGGARSRNAPAFLLTIPSTIGLMLLARPIISLIYEHGKFNAHATDQAALGLQGYAIGLCAYSALKILTPAFYAIGRDARRCWSAFSRSR